MYQMMVGYNYTSIIYILFNQNKNQYGNLLDLADYITLTFSDLFLIV